MSPFSIMQIATIGFMAAGAGLMMKRDNRAAAIAFIVAVAGTHGLLLLGKMLTKQ